MIAKWQVKLFKLKPAAFRKEAFCARIKGFIYGKHMKKLLQKIRDNHRQEEFHTSVFEQNLDESHPYPDFNKAVYSWIAPEYLQHPKSVQWWVAAGIVWAIAIVIEALTGNWTMLLATAVFGLVYWFTHEMHPPRKTKVNLTELGLKIGHKHFPFSQIEFFWIIYNPPHVKRLYLRLKDRFLPDMIVELEDQNPQEIREFLEQHLSEVTGVKEHYADVLLRLFKL